jgi:predicted HicB family RNase H-like nuclease
VNTVFVIKKPHAKANVSKTIRFTEELNNRMIALAHEEEISFNELVIQCCQYALDHRQKAGQEELTDD